MDLFHKLIDLIDRNAEKIPEGDYLELCDTIHKLRHKVKPPSFLIDQNQPLYLPTETGVNSVQSEDEEVAYPGLNEFLQELHEEWTDREVNSPHET